MKKLIRFLVPVVLVLAAVACQDEKDPEVALVPGLASTSIENGATGVSVSVGSITLTYDTPVTVDASKISLSGTTVTAVAQNLRVVVSFGTLDYDTSYNLVLSSGAVTATTGGAAAAAYSLTFTTEEDPNGGGGGNEGGGYTPGTPGDYSASLAMSNPIASATTLYNYLLSIYGSYTLSGAMAQVNWNTDEAEWIANWTGKYPAIAFFDYIHLAESPANWIDYSDITPVSDWWNAGGLVGAGWHWRVPVSQGSSELSYEPSDFSAADAVKSGTWENTVVNDDLDKIAGYLTLLQDAGIPVLWRPLHEASGNIHTQWNGDAWFWWGADGADAYKALWQYVFNYLQDKGVRNLIWVWTTQTTTTTYADYDFYPGDDYVDIVGKDVYDDSSASDIASQFTTVTQMTTHKMVTLSEMGNVAGIGDQWSAGAKWLYFMPWYDYDNDGTRNYAHIYADINWWTAAFGSSNVIDRSGLPSTLFE